MNKITFIIPTIGRETLYNSINSLLNQTIKEWNAIIIFDGIKQNFYISDDRIIIIEIDKKGKDFNSAGYVRNYGMDLVKTEWIGFLDDDDIIADDYIETFYKELDNYNDISVFIFRMLLDNRVIPKVKTDNFYICDVGISFIINKRIYDNGIKFVADGAEDYLFLNKIRNNGYKIMICPHIKYFVKHLEYNINDNNILGNRVIINNNVNSILFKGYYYLISNLQKY